MTLTSGAGCASYVARLTDNGDVVLVRAFPGVAYAVATHAGDGGEIAITGNFTGTVDFGAGPVSSAGSEDVFVARFASDGSLRWVKTFGGVDQDWGLALDFDADGAIVVAGFVQDNVDFGFGATAAIGGTDMFLAKLSATGATEWARRIGGPDASISPSALAIDPMGDLVVAGWFSGMMPLGPALVPDSGGQDIFLAKYSPDGQTMLWGAKFGSPGIDRANALALGAAGEIVFTGFFEDHIDFMGGELTSAGIGDLFITSFSVDGNHRASRSFGGVGDDYARGIAVGPAGDVYVTGDFQNVVDFGGGPEQALDPWEIFVASYDRDLNFRSAKAFGSSDGTHSEHIGQAIAVISSGDVVATGRFGGSVDFIGTTLVDPGQGDMYAVCLPR